MENFYQIYHCEEYKFRVFLNANNSELLKKFHEIHRNEILVNKFIYVIEAVKEGIQNRTQYNWEADICYGKVYAIKVDSHRFYTLQVTNNGFKELYICRYGKKESQKNDKTLNAIIQSIDGINIKTRLTWNT